VPVAAAVCVMLPVSTAPARYFSGGGVASWPRLVYANPAAPATSRAPAISPRLLVKIFIVSPVWIDAQ
jgi:hypothetical protein